MNEKAKWICVFKSNNKFEAEAVKGNLENLGIPCVELNKQDSSYLNFGYVELHIPEEFVDAANEIIQQNNENN